MSLAIKSMIVTSDGSSFDNVIEAQVHELQCLLKEEHGNNVISAEDAANFIVHNWQKVRDIIVTKPKKASSRKKATRTRAKKPAPAPAPEADAPKEVAKPAPKARAARVEAEPAEPVQGVRIETSDKWKDK